MDRQIDTKDDHNTCSTYKHAGNNDSTHNLPTPQVSGYGSGLLLIGVRFMLAKTVPTSPP